MQGNQSEFVKSFGFTKRCQLLIKIQLVSENN
jgi:hypothetical protein